MTSNGPAGPAICVLGPLSLWAGGTSVAVGGPLPRRLLCVLLVSRDGVVSRDRLVEVLWGDDPPDGALPSLHSSVSRLRRLLPASVRLETVTPGYRLGVDAGALDVDRFEAGLDDALERAGGDPQAALAGLEGALACWKGDAYAEFRDEWWARGEAVRLEERRVHAREARAEVLLALGHDEAAAGAARAVTVDDPSRERAWRVLVLALHRGGRQSEALRAAHEYRARLRDDSGLEPSADFAALEHDIAVDNPQIRTPTPPPSARPITSTELGDAVSTLRSLETVFGNLPRMRASLIGRERETDEVLGLLERAWLVTVTGVGGVGKTRLAVEAAGRVTSRFPGGVWLVELAAALAGGDVGGAVASTLGIKVPAGRSPVESVVDALEGQRVLLVLDNCEHVLDALAELVSWIGARHDSVVILATSREALAVPGEQTYPLRSLETAAAARLFDCRLQEHRGGVGVAAHEWPIVEELCQRLDGLPLAVELAAARARSMGVAELTARLAERFRLLRGGRRTVERHQTLRATVAWSYELLDGREQALFDRLSVFAGGFDLAAAEAVCVDDALGRVDVDNLLGSLVDKSMVSIGAGDRYGLLETLRQFGEEQLAQSGHSERFRAAHLAHYEGLVLQAHDGRQGPHEASWYRRLGGEAANVRAAFAWACDRGNVDAAVTIATHLVRPTFWHSGGEPFEWIRTAGALPGASDHPRWPSVLAGMARAEFDQGDLAAAAALADRAAAAQGADAGTSVDYLVEEVVAVTRVWQGRLAEALPVCARVIELAGRDAKSSDEAMFEGLQATILTSMGRVNDAVAAGHRAERLADATGNPTTMAWARWSHGIALADTRPDQALGPLEEALEIAVAADSTWLMSACLRNIASIRADLGDPLVALDLVMQAVQLLRRQGVWAQVWAALLDVAEVLARLERADTAAQLLAGVRRSSAALLPQVVRVANRLQARLTDDLGAARLAELGRTGEQLTAPQAVALAEAEAARLLR